jgi:hypothetical protein
MPIGQSQKEIQELTCNYFNFNNSKQAPMKLIVPDIWKSAHGEEQKENEKVKEKDIENLAACVLSVIEITIFSSIGNQFHWR